MGPAPAHDDLAASKRRSGAKNKQEDCCSGLKTCVKVCCCWLLVCVYTREDTGCTTDSWRNQ